MGAMCAGRLAKPPVLGSKVQAWQGRVWMSSGGPDCRTPPPPRKQGIRLGTSLPEEAGVSCALC